MRMTAALLTRLRKPASDGSDPGAPTKRRTSRGVRHELLAFFAVSLIVTLAVAGATILLSGWIAKKNQLDDAERAATRIADNLVKPLLSGVADGRPVPNEALDTALASRLKDGSVFTFLVWSAEGEVLYATDDAYVGQQPAITDELAAALSGEVISQLDDSPELPRPTQRPSWAPLLEVYVPITVDGEAVRLRDVLQRGERRPGRRAAAQPDRATHHRGHRGAGSGAVAPGAVPGPPAAPAGGGAHRAGAQQPDRLGPGAPEIAADVHDGPVQELAGVSYALSALRPNMAEAQQVTVDRVVKDVRSAVASLRRLMVQIYPPDLSGPGLGAALDDLAVPLREQGLTVHVQEANKPGMSPAAAAVLYRTAREALTNVSRHAMASTVWIRLDETQHDGLPAVRLTVADDGVGLAEPPESSPEGWARCRRRCRSRPG